MQERLDVGSPYDSGQYNSIGDDTHQTDYQTSQPQPHPLQSTWGTKLLRLCFDLLVSAIALLFAVFGILVYRNDGKSASPNSTGQKLHEISRYVSFILNYS